MDLAQVDENQPAPTLTQPRSGLFLRAFNRIFTRHLMNMALLMLAAFTLPGIFMRPDGFIHDPDLWWHMANARLLTTTHHFIQMEPYSFTVAGARWVNPEWLAEIPFWKSYQTLGLTGIFLMTVIALGANLLLIYWRCYWNAHHAGAALWSSLLGLILLTVNFGPRMILFGYLALSAEMAILEAVTRQNASPQRKRLLWLLPPLFCLWINLHGSWVMGLALLGLYILCGMFSLSKGAIEQKGFSSADRNRLLLVFLSCSALLLVNPYGWRLVWSPFDMMMNQKLNIGIVQEWQPLSLSSGAGLATILAIALTVVANLAGPRKWKLYELGVLFFAWYAALHHTRFAFLASVLIIPWLCTDLTRAFFAEQTPKTIPVINAAFATGVLCFFVHYFPTEQKLQRDLATDYPLQSIASIQPSWRTCNIDVLGGMMDFNFKPTFLDSRLDTFEHHGVLKDQIDIMQIHDSLALLDKYHVDHALLGAKQPLVYLLERTPGWQVDKREGAGDNAFVLLQKNSTVAE